LIFIGELQRALCTRIFQQHQNIEGNILLISVLPWMHK
jgi:hypothetical protein